MSGSNEAILALALLLVALCGGLYLSGYLTLLLIGTDAPVTRRLWWDCHKALADPQYAPYAWKIHFGGIVGLGAPGLVWLGCIIRLLKSSPARTLHGDAHFSTRRDLEKQGLLNDSPEGIIVGKFDRDLIRLIGQQFLILAAPTRSGKGVGVVIPNLLSYLGPIVVLGIKLENFLLTSGWRRLMGHKIFLFNPFVEDRRTHRWNPLDAANALSRFKATVLVHANNFREKMFFVAFDGTGNNKYQANEWMRVGIADMEDRK